MTSVLETNNFDTPIADIPTYDELIHKYIGESFTSIVTREGTANIVSSYTFSDGRKIAVRKSKSSTFIVNSNGDVRPLYQMHDYDNRDEFVKDINTTKLNWTKAVRAEIAPEMYFYGYIKVPISNGNQLYQVMISRGYDTDLYAYYNDPSYQGYRNKQSRELTENDINIAKQLISLLHKSHADLKIICFDIKPHNCVINISDDGVEVKLIDWDGDWCNDFSGLLDSTGADTQIPNIDILSQIVMANHFFMPANLGCGWNIFSKYFSNNMDNSYGRDVFSDKHKALTHLFCELKDTEYVMMARHYFKLNNGMSCPDMLKEMIERCKLLKPPSNILQQSITARGGRNTKKTRKNLI